MPTLPFQPIRNLLQRNILGLRLSAFDGTFPDFKNSPPVFPQDPQIAIVPGLIALDLHFPPVCPAIGPLKPVAVVSMPETSMDEDHCPVLWENDVRGSRSGVPGRSSL